MDLDEVTTRVAKIRLHISHENEEILNLNESDVKIGEQHIENCLVPKVLSTKYVNREAFKQQMPRILQAVRSVEVGFLGDNLFLLDFKSKHDKLRALRGGPWNFFRDLVIFCELAGMQNPSTMTFNEISIWVQCYNLPLILMNKEALTKVGQQIGSVEEIDARENGLAMGNFVRLRVRIKITTPLKQFIRVSRSQNEDDIIVLLAYERLPDFCYKCGRLGHSLIVCDEPSPDNGQLGFGSWMRASNRASGDNPRNKSPTKSSGKTAGYPSGSSSTTNKEIIGIDRVEEGIQTSHSHGTDQRQRNTDIALAWH